MASFSHPNLALVFGAEVWQGQPLLVLEYLPGGTLADRLRRGPLGVRRAISLGIEMTSVLEAIHKAGVLHRDIKPSNIGFTAEGIPKLLDFGLARLMSSTAIAPRRPTPQPLEEQARVARGWSGVEQLTARSVTDGMIRGTPLYMSPEAQDGQSPDSTFDLWSLNVVLYEAIFGRHPFLDEPPTSELRPPPTSDSTTGERSAPSLAVVEFFTRALSENRKERPSSASELAACLRRLMPSLDGG
jgi:serine/threonine protein kinase